MIFEPYNTLPLFFVNKLFSSDKYVISVFNKLFSEVLFSNKHETNRVITFLLLKISIIVPSFAILPINEELKI